MTSRTYAHDQQGSHSAQLAVNEAVGPIDVPRRLMYVITGLNWGGAESQVIDLALSFRKRGWEVCVVTLLAKAERRYALEAQGVVVHTLGMDRGVPDPRAIVRLARIIRKSSPAVVHAHMVHANLLTRIVRIVAPVPVLISSAHNVYEGGRWMAMAYRVTDRLGDLMTNVSHAAVRRSIESKAVPENRIRFMPNGIDMNRFASSKGNRAAARGQLGLEGRFMWLAVGRFEKPKDYPNLIEAFAQVVHHTACPILMIAGDGSLRDEIESDVRDRGLDGAIRFLGLRHDIPELMSAADAYVMSSAWEGLPIVLLEAAASGLSIVATDVGGNAQIVVHNQTGSLVPSRDSRALADAMARTMDLPAHDRAARGKAGAAHTRAIFELSTTVDQWEALYGELYAGRTI